MYVRRVLSKIYLEIFNRADVLRLLIHQEGPYTVRSLSADQQAQSSSPIVSDESILFELDSYPLCSHWPTERLLIVSGPFLDILD